MCMCEKPTINGEPGYSWDGRHHSVRQPDPPDLSEQDDLLFDEPGRCGELDSHAFHFRVVKNMGRHYLLVKHGGGLERFCLGGRPGTALFKGMSSNGRYWMLQMIYHSIKDSVRSAVEDESNRWRTAAADKRIKTRKIRGCDASKVWIEPATGEDA